MATTNVQQMPKVAPLQFFEEIVSELKKVEWPTREETIQLTLIVLVVSIVVGAFIGGLDVLFVSLTQYLFKR